jgi:Ring finger domain
VFCVPKTCDNFVMCIGKGIPTAQLPVHLVRWLWVVSRVRAVSVTFYLLGNRVSRLHAPGASEREIEDLQSYTCDEATASRHRCADSACPICLGCFEVGEVLSSLACGHDHHRACLVEWLRLSACCPMCKLQCCAASSHERSATEEGHQAGLGASDWAARPESAALQGDEQHATAGVAMHREGESLLAAHGASEDRLNEDGSSSRASTPATLSSQERSSVATVQGQDSTSQELGQVVQAKS